MFFILYTYSCAIFNTLNKVPNMQLSNKEDLYFFKIFILYFLSNKWICSKHWKVKYLWIQNSLLWVIGFCQIKKIFFGMALNIYTFKQRIIFNDKWTLCMKYEKWHGNSSREMIEGLARVGVWLHIVLRVFILYGVRSS